MSYEDMKRELRERLERLKEESGNPKQEIEKEVVAGCEIEWYAGLLTKVCGEDVLGPLLPDWALYCVEFETTEEKERIRKVLVRLEVRGDIKRIRKITDRRIYFE